MLKFLFTALLCCLFCQLKLAAQTDSVSRQTQDTTRRTVPAVRVYSAANRIADSLKKVRADSLKARTDSLNLARVDSLKKRAADSLKLVADSIRALNDSLATIRANELIISRIAAIQATLKQHKYIPFSGRAQSRTLDEKATSDKDLLFYFLCGLVLYFAIFKLFFGKYLSNLFTLFFRVTMRQQQIREQLLQTPLPSLLLNILFAISAGMYLNLLLFRFHQNPVPDFWLNFSYCVGIVSLLYLGKLLILTAMGWIFNVSNATNTYLFIVFLVNKMLGMFLLPFLFILAFPHPVIISGMVTLSYILVIALFFYRFIISYRPIRNEINVGRLHFIIYLCAFEIAPLLLIYKVLLMFVERNK
ncbi:DUF4271 domain-containing protein [Flavitalea sp.]|nr:DUF4271 domain-containing protein [Flavitalea sp.]